MRNLFTPDAGKWFVGLLGLLVSGCASTNPSLPIRKIDQPYTLPMDTREFAAGGGYRYKQQRPEPAERDFVFNEARLSGPISDTWTWDYLSHFRHQLHHDEQDTYGFGLGFREVGYSSFDGLYVMPTVSAYYRRNLSRSFALEAEFQSVYAIYTDNDARPWAFGFTLSPLWQVDDSKYLRFSVGVAKEQSFDQLRAIFDDFRVVSSQRRTRIAAPLGLTFGWRFDVQWEARVNYNYQGIGYGSGYRAHGLGLAFSRYW